MFAIVILSAMLAGQATDWQGYASPDGKTYVIKQHSVKYDGMDIVVEGYFNRERGTVVWSPDREFNRRSMTAAMAARNKPAATPIKNYGLNPERIGHTPITQTSPEARRFIAEASESAGAGKLHLTVIGSDEARAAVMHDVRTHPDFSGLKDRLYIQDYKPDEWAVDPSHGFQVQGKPSIILQSPRGPRDPKGGRVLYRALDYSMGPKVLSEAISEEVRKADPSYRPTMDPGPATAGDSVFLGLTADNIAYILIGVVVLLAASSLPRKDTES